MKINEEIENCLLVLMEECSEVQKICSKIIRFGFKSYHPEDIKKETNTIKLAQEIGDLSGALIKLKELCPEIIDDEWIIIADYFAKNKPDKIDKYYQISQELKDV